MITYIFITVSVIIAVSYIIWHFYSKNSYYKINDYSSNKMQDRTFFKDLNGFSFTPEPIEQRKKDIHILNKVLKNAKSMPKEKKLKIKKVIEKIKQGKFSFSNPLTYDLAIILINLSLDDLEDIINMDKQRIIFKVFILNGQLEINEEELGKASRHGISEEELKDWYSKKYAENITQSGFISKETYNLIYEDYIKNCDENNKEDIKKLASKLEDVFNEEQKNKIKDCSIKYTDIARSLVYYGRNTIYHFSKLRQILPDDYFLENEKGPIIKILNGTDCVDEETKSVTKDVNLSIDIIKFNPIDNINNKLKKAVTNISYINAFNNHDKIIETIENAKKRYIPIPKILVNFDSHSDIYLNKPGNKTLADWVNNVAKDYKISDVYWVVPDRGFYNFEVINHFFGENIPDKTAFKGNYNSNNPYRNFKKPLFQRFLINNEDATILTKPIDLSDPDVDNGLKSGKYRIINVHTCTQHSLPKFKKDFILSIDADFFNCCGFDSADFLEQLPCNPNKYFNQFLLTWIKKLNKASIVGLCISPEYIGLDSIGITRGFYEYILNTANNNSKYIY